MESTTLTTESAPTSPAAPTETSPPETAPSSPPITSKQLLEIARRERRLVEQEKASRELLAKNEQAVKEAEEWRNKKETWKQKPSEVLKLLGVDFKDLAKHMIDEDKPLSAEEKLEQFKEELRQKEESAKAAQEQREKEENEKSLANFKNQINDHLKNNIEDYELINLSNNHDLVFHVIDMHFQETGDVMSTKEAAQKVEDYLFNSSQETMKKSKKLSGFAKQWLSESSTSDKKEQSKSDESSSLAAKIRARKQQQQSSPTSITSSKLNSNSSNDEEPKTESREEKIARLAKQLWKK